MAVTERPVMVAVRSRVADLIVLAHALAAPLRHQPRSPVGVGAMAVCCTLALLIAVGILGTLSGAAIGGIAVAAGIAVTATIWVTLVLLHWRRISHDTCCPPGSNTTPPGAHR